MQPPARPGRGVRSRRDHLRSRRRQGAASSKGSNPATSHRRRHRQADELIAELARLDVAMTRSKDVDRRSGGRVSGRGSPTSTGSARSSWRCSSPTPATRPGSRPPAATPATTRPPRSSIVRRPNTHRLHGGQPPTEPGPPHRSDHPDPPPHTRAAATTTARSPKARPQRSHALAEAPAHRRGLAAPRRRRPTPRHQLTAGPGGHPGLLDSCVTGSNLNTGASAKSLPGPETRP